MVIISYKIGKQIKPAIFFRCLIRKKMIERGLLDWLIVYLSELDSSSSNQQHQSVTSDYQSSYGLEYATALFMNLCLHKSAKEKCLPKARVILQVLVRLLGKCSKQVCLYNVSQMIVDDIKTFYF